MSTVGNPDSSENRDNLDPIMFVHEDVHDYIFQHLDSADVLISSEVTKLWWNVLGGSRECMSKIKLGLNSWWNTEPAISEVMEIIENSERKYQCLTVNCNDDQVVSENAVRMLSALAPSLVELKFLNSDGGPFGAGLKFPKLRCLQFAHNSKFIDNMLLQGSDTLTELNLRNFVSSWPYPIAVLQCLKNNKHLNRLTLWDSSIGRLFEFYEPGSFEFKLKQFSTGTDGVISQKAEDNFVDFLETQSDSLQAIRFRAGLNGVSTRVMNKVFRMRELRIIHLDGIADLDYLKLEQNSKIHELRLPWTVNSVDKLSTFIEALPNISILSIKSVNRELLEYIIPKLKQLKIIFYSNVNGCSRCYQHFLTENEDCKTIKLVCKEWS